MAHQIGSRLHTAHTGKVATLPARHGDIIDAAELVLSRAQAVLSTATGRTTIGGYFVIMNCQNDGYFQFPAGRLGTDNWSRHRRTSLAQARRLHGLLRRQEIRTSDGAVVTGSPTTTEQRFILNFDGRPGLAKLAVALALAVALHQLPARTAEAIAVSSHDQYFKSLCRAMDVTNT